MGNTRSGNVYRRRLDVKKLYLKGLSTTEIATQLGVSEAVIQSDIREINRWYLQAVEKNPHILEKQAEYILRHLDELKMVKQKFWELQTSATCDKDKIAALKGVLDELSHEARVLKLIDVSKSITQYIHVDKIGILVQNVIDVIKEFVPIEKQKYALERLKTAGKDIIDVTPTSIKEGE